MKKHYIIPIMILLVTTAASACRAEDDPTTKVLKSGLVGAGTGALAAGVTGGKAGEGALIGAGTGIIGSVLLDAITGSSSRGRGYPDDEYYPADDADAYYYDREEDPTRKVLKDGLVGAGTGAIAAGATGGKAGQGALIGAGTGAVGNALLDTLTQPAPQRSRRVYRRAATKEEPRTKIIRKYDENGNLIYEEIIPME